MREGTKKKGGTASKGGTERLATENRRAFSNLKALLSLSLSAPLLVVLLFKNPQKETKCPHLEPVRELDAVVVGRGEASGEGEDGDEREQSILEKGHREFDSTFFEGKNRAVFGFSIEKLENA